jgi:hypothetical protein
VLLRPWISPSGISSMKEMSSSSVERELDEIGEFVIVDAAHHHRIQLGAPETGGLRRIDAVQAPCSGRRSG